MNTEEEKISGHRLVLLYFLAYSRMRTEFTLLIMSIIQTQEQAAALMRFIVTLNPVEIWENKRYAEEEILGKAMQIDEDYTNMNKQTNTRYLVVQTANFGAELLLLWLDKKLISEKSMDQIAQYSGKLPSWEARAAYSKAMLQVFQESTTEAEIMQGFHNYVNSTTLE